MFLFLINLFLFVYYFLCLRPFKPTFRARHYIFCVLKINKNSD